MTVIVTATGLFKCLLNMKKGTFFPKYISQFTCEPEVTWENSFWAALASFEVSVALNPNP